MILDTSVKEALDEENTTKNYVKNVQNEGNPWTKHMNEAKGAEWGKGKNNPGQSHRNPMLEELKDEYGNEGHNQR